MDNDSIFNTIEQNSGFEDSQKPHTDIKVVGVGGGGNNAINHMYVQNVEGVSFVVINTDRQALNQSPVPNRLLIGPNTTQGRGAGNIPEVARQAAEESSNEIAALFDDETKMVFITAGMGGGTGTGAAPVVARIAKEKGLLTIGIVTIPFLFEGQRKILKALAGADEMSKYVDALLIINNQRLTDIYPDLDFFNAFGKADDTLSTAARSISDLININGRINLDFNDVNTTLRDGGVAIISSGYGEGDHRVTKAIEDALKSPLLRNRDVFGARKVLMNIYVNPESKSQFRMAEIDEIEAFMANFSNEVDVIWGLANDSTLDEQIKITVLAAGFNVSLENESPTVTDAAPKIKHPVAASAKPVQDPTQLMKDVYGSTAVDNALTAQARAKFVMLEIDDMDNDEIIELIERNPTFGRKPEVRTAIKEKQDKAAENANKPVEPAPRPTTTQQRNTKAGTIDFAGE